MELFYSIIDIIMHILATFVLLLAIVVFIRLACLALKDD